MREMAIPAVGENAVLADSRVRVQAGLISLGVSVVLLVAKYQAYRLTGSTAILSDALESIVNVVAAVFALGASLSRPSLPTGIIRTVTGRSSSSPPPSRAASSPSRPCSSSTR
mgnify:CR=1 FL=1